MPHYCAIRSCKNTNKNCYMHSITRREPGYQQWLRAIGRADLYEKPKKKVCSSVYVCDIHFAPSSKFPKTGKTNLKPGSVPSLFLDVPFDITIDLPTQPTMSNKEREEGVTDVEVPSCSKNTLMDVEDQDTKIRVSISMKCPEDLNTEVQLSTPMQTAEDIITDLEVSTPMQTVEDLNTELQVSTPLQTAEDESLELFSFQCAEEEVIEDQPPSPINSSVMHVEEVHTSSTKSTKYPCCHVRRCYTPHKINLQRILKMTRKKRLSPQAKELHQFLQDIQRTARQLNEENASNQKYIHHAIEASKTAEVLRLRMKESSFDLFMSQLRSQRAKPQGRHFSMEDKVFALSIFKQSPKIYTFLSKIFVLPLRKCMKQLLDRIPVGPGINERILEMLKDACEHMNEAEKYCALLFDERPINPGIYFNKSDSSIDGFAYSDERTKLGFADHVLVFMVCGILKKWKQPVAYFFSENRMSVPDLSTNIQMIIKDLQDIGLYVATTICDQSGNNVKTIRGLIKETTQKLTLEENENHARGFHIGGEEIFPLFDPPSLLKSVRNNLLKYDATFMWKGTDLTACWLDVVKLYELDNGEPDTKILPKLSDCHIYERKINKTNTKLAAQVLSERTSASMKFLAKYGKHTLITNTMIGTSEFLLFFDTLFDSVNGSVRDCDDKPFKCAISASSKHIEFYTEAIQVLRTITFKKHECEFVPLCIFNWICTLKSLECIWDKLHSRGIEILCPRNLNLDLLKNFFGRLRNRSVRNKNLTCCSFKTSYKALIVSNFLSNHSPYANCDGNGCKGALNFLQHILNRHFSQRNILTSPRDITDVFVFDNNYNCLGDSTNAYVAGFLERDLLKKIQGCNTCKRELNSVTSEITGSHIERPNYDDTWVLLKYNTAFYKYISRSFQIISFYLPKICTFSHIVPFLKTKIKSLITPKYFHCKSHDLTKLIDNYLIPLYVVMWIQNVNSTLKGKVYTKITDNVRDLAIRKYHKVMLQPYGN